MTPDAPDLPKQSKKGDFHLVEFSLTDKARAGSLEHIPFLDLTEDYVTRVLSTHFGSPSVAR